MVLSVLPIQTIEYLCSQEYSRLEGLSGDHLVQAFSGSRNFDQIAWDLFSFEFSQKLGGPCVLPLLTRVFPWETFFFRFLLFLSLIGACAFYSFKECKESFSLLYTLWLHT